MMADARQSTAQTQTVFTIGHSNVEVAAFLALLTQHAVEVLVDVRSEPYSKYVPHFNGPALRRAAEAAGLKYLYLGRELGGRPKETRYYDAEGHVRYDLVAASPQFLAGVERLLQGVGKLRVALMCNEENPTECHRRLLVGRVLAEHGVAVVHIRGDGRLQPEADLAESERGPASHQQELSFVAREKPEWKSTRSVSQARPQKRSSAH